METSSIHEKGTVQSDPETQKGPPRGRHIHPSGGGHLRGLTPPRCSWLSPIELARRPLCDESYDGNGDGTPRPSVPQVMTMLVAEGNRLSSAAMAIRPSIEAHIAWLKGEPAWEPGIPAGVPSLHHRPSGPR